MVATEGSLSAAAKALSVTQPTLSEQLRQLEDRLGGPLFDRKGRRLVINERGKRALSYTLRMFNISDELEHELVSPRGSRAHTISVGVTPSLSTSLAIHFLLPVLKKASFHVLVNELPLDDLRDPIKRRNFDIVFSDQSLPHKSLDFKSVKIAESKLVIVCSAKHQKGKINLKNLSKNLPYFAFTQNSHLRFEIEHFFGIEKIHPVVMGETDESHFMRLATQMNLCFSILPIEVVQNEIKAGVLKNIKTLPDATSSTFLIYRPQESNPHILSAIESIRRRFQK